MTTPLALPARLLLSLGVLLGACATLNACMSVRGSATRPPRAARVVTPPPPSISSRDAGEVLTNLHANHRADWEAVGEPASRDLAAYQEFSFPVTRGRCYIAAMVLEAQSAWPAQHEWSVSYERASRTMSAYAEPQGPTMRNGRWDAEHPIGLFSEHCVDADGVARLTPDPRPSPPGAAPGRVRIAVRSRALLDLAAGHTPPEGWPSSFTILPGRVTSRTSSQVAGTTHHLVTVQTEVSSMDLVDWFYRQVAERAGFRLAGERESQEGTARSLSRTFRSGRQVWSVVFYASRMQGGQAGTVTVMHAVDL